MENYNILVIDDLDSMHEDFTSILIPKKNLAADRLQKLKPLLFDEAADTENQLPPFSIDSAYQGEEGLELVRLSLSKGRHYALAFVDVLMPPGSDGIETISKMWEIDPKIQIVICTAYAKYTWEDIRKKLGSKDNFFILKKPFDRMEVIQLACALTKKWNLQQRIREPATDLTMSSDNFGIDSTIASIKSNMDELKGILDKF